MVFPIPISPVAMRPYPLALSLDTISIPASIPLTASSLVIAGSFTMFFVPMATLRSVGTFVSTAIPTSTGYTSVPH